MRIRRRFYIWTFTCTVAIGLLQHPTAYAQCAGGCGDANASGSITGADWESIMAWMWFGVTPAGSVGCADIDRYQDVTVRDAVLMMRCIFVCDPPEASFHCESPLPPIMPIATEAISIYYNRIFPAGDSSVTISLRLHTEELLLAMTLPLQVRMNGTIPDIEVIQTDPNDVWTIDTSNTSPPVTGTGELLLGFQNLNSNRYENDDPIAILRISAPPAAGDRAILLQYTSLPPSNVVMALTDDWEFGDALQPNLFSCAVDVFGDYVASGTVTALDIVMFVQWLFKRGGPLPIPCEAEVDVNCSGADTSADLIYLVNYIFKSGPAPCNVCELVGNGTWNCP